MTTKERREFAAARAQEIREAIQAEADAADAYLADVVRLTKLSVEISDMDRHVDAEDLNALATLAAKKEQVSRFIKLAAEANTKRTDEAGARMASAMTMAGLSELFNSESDALVETIADKLKPYCPDASRRNWLARHCEAVAGIGRYVYLAHNGNRILQDELLTVLDGIAEKNPPWLFNQ